MKPRPENVEPAALVGYLAADGILYCSAACAERPVHARAMPVDLF